MNGSTHYTDTPRWNWKDAAALSLVIGAHALGLWQFIRSKPTPPPPEPVPIQVSLILPPDEPPPPEPPKPPPPREQPKQPPKETPKPTLEPPPPVVTETPVAKPIAPPPPTPPAPPTPPVVQTAPSTGSYLQLRTDVKPIYPRKALQNGIEGKVVLMISVDERGLPEDVQVVQSSGNFELDNAARAAAKRCVFVPPTVNGVPVKGKGLREIVFKLSDQ